MSIFFDFSLFPAFEFDNTTLHSYRSPWQFRMVQLKHYYYCYSIESNKINRQYKNNYSIFYVEEFYSGLHKRPMARHWRELGGIPCHQRTGLLVQQLCITYPPVEPCILRTCQFLEIVKHINFTKLLCYPLLKGKCQCKGTIYHKYHKTFMLFVTRK